MTGKSKTWLEGAGAVWMGVVGGVKDRMMGNWSVAKPQWHIVNNESKDMDKALAWATKHFRMLSSVLKSFITFKKSS